MNKFNQSPLPFQGQKRRFLKLFKQHLNDFPEKGIYIDLFGGSGLLSHVVKQIYPDARVVWNDYDDFQTRLNNVNMTNGIRLCVRWRIKPLKLN